MNLMDKEKIRKYLLDIKNRPFSQIIPRNIIWDESTKIQTIIGVRRCGKTFLLFQKMQELFQKGIKPFQTLYLNFEHPILSTIKFDEIKQILEIYWSLFPDAINSTLYLFIDEPQEIIKWESAVRELIDLFDIRIFITGSSSKLLSQEISTNLRGRSINIKLFTLSFQEFLEFKAIKFNVPYLNTQESAKMLHLLDEYLQFGGYPDVALVPNINEKLKILQTYYELTLYRDLMERYSIKHSNIMKLTLTHLVANCGKEFSVNKWFNTLKSQNFTVTKNTLYEYFGILNDCGFIFSILKFDPSIKNENLSLPKMYLNDVGFYTLLLQEKPTIRLETVIARDLLEVTTKNPLSRLRYWKSAQNYEVDFVYITKEDKLWAIQVAWSIENSDTATREIRSLLEFKKNFPQSELIIITYNEKELKIVENYEIKIIPIWQWLLEHRNFF
jgi:predicted AAA+ superfamily ATPase